MLSGLRRRGSDEDGATLVIFCLILVGLLVSAGLVVDLGLVRADRTRNKSVSDVAVSAGLQSLNLGGYVAPFRGACSALAYLKINHPELSSLNLSSGWTYGGVGPISGAGNPCDSATTAFTNNYGTLCNATAADARSTFAWYESTAGGIDVAVRAGYPTSDMTSGGFADESYTDPADPNQYGCDQLAVIVTERENTGFGRLAGMSTLSTKVRSVGRVDVGFTQEEAIALLLLERNDCGSLLIGGGATVVVKGTNDRPGIVHSDSLGNGNFCSGGGSKKVLQGDHSSPPGVLAERAPCLTSELPAPCPATPFTGRAPGIVTTAAANGPPGVAARATDSPNVVAQGSTPGGHGPIGRKPVDETYRTGILAVEDDADTKFGWDQTTAENNFYKYYPTCAVPATVTAAQAPTGKVFINCDNFTAPTTFENTISDVVFTGKISQTGGALRFKNPRRIYVYGDSGNGQPTGVSLNGTLMEVNVNDASPSAASPTAAPADCADRFVQDRSATTKFVIGHGKLDMSGGPTLRLCQTTLLMADGSTGATPTSGIPTTDGTMPADNGYKGSLKTTGGSTIDWSAPNRTSDKATALEHADLEDLALWTETSAGSSLNGSGTSMSLKGVFFLPNSNTFSINAGTGTITADAQFITRFLEVSGTGATLNLRANPNDTVPQPYVRGAQLVR